MVKIAESQDRTQSLSTRLVRMAREGDAAMLENVKLLLCMAAGGVAPSNAKFDDDLALAGLDVVADALRELCPAGLLHVGRMASISASTLKALQQEADEVRKVARRSDRYVLGCGGPAADKLAVDSTLLAEVRTFAPGASPTGIASYLYYEEAGQGLSPHVDTDVFSLNVIVTLAQDPGDDGHKSALVVYEGRSAPRRIISQPGDTVVLLAGGTIHGREDLTAGERVRILTIGYSVPQ